MARINFDDNIEAQPEFWSLLEVIGGNRDTALGMLVRFFRICQHHFGRNEPVPLQEIESQKLDAMIKSGWAVKHGDGFQVKGADKHFGWYRQKCASAVTGGQARSTAPRDENGRFTPAGVQPDAGKTQPVTTPLALAPSLAPALVQKKEEPPKKPKPSVSEFDILYQRYPRKEGKRKAIERMGRLVKSWGDLDLLSEAIEKFKTHHLARGTEASFIPHMTTFLGTEKVPSWRDCLEPDYGRSEIDGKNSTAKRSDLEEMDRLVAEEKERVRLLNAQAG